VLAFGSVAARSSANTHSTRTWRQLRCARKDEFGIQWLLEENLQATDTTETVRVPVVLVEDVHLPGSPVCLPVTDPNIRKLYDSLLTAGGRLVAAVLYDQEKHQMAAFATILYLEDFVETQSGYLATHFAVARARLRRNFPGEDWLQAEVEIFWDGEATSLEPAEALDAELSELGRLQEKRGQESQSAGLRSALALPEPLAEQIQALQGLWRAKSGVRIRIDGDEAQDLGKLQLDQDGQVFIQVGSQAFSAATSSQGADGAVDVLSWDDGDVWHRLAAPPPARAAQAAAALWQAARRWRSLGAWRAEARRGEARWNSAADLAKSSARPWDPDSPDEVAAAAWATAAQKADDDAKVELWEEVLRPCQRLLQAQSVADRIEIFREMLQAEITQMRLLQAIDPRSED